MANSDKSGSSLKFILQKRFLSYGSPTEILRKTLFENQKFYKSYRRVLYIILHRCTPPVGHANIQKLQIGQGTPISKQHSKLVGHSFIKDFKLDGHAKIQKALQIRQGLSIFDKTLQIVSYTHQYLKGHYKFGRGCQCSNGHPKLS